MQNHCAYAILDVPRLVRYEKGAVICGRSGLSRVEVLHGGLIPLTERSSRNKNISHHFSGEFTGRWPGSEKTPDYQTKIVELGVDAIKEALN